ncbi:hypothetical protein CGRA01v4_00516 [Colletotrichum graminicola]|nr:hypothetical protein CGRA01v4_00516 [Colletotrichum graminicola]
MLGARGYFFPPFATALSFAFAPGQCPSSFRPFPAIGILQHIELPTYSSPTKQCLQDRNATQRFLILTTRIKKQEKMTESSSTTSRFASQSSLIALHEHEQGQRPLAADTNPHGGCQGLWKPPGKKVF